MQSCGGFPEAIGFVIDFGRKVIDGALAQDAGKAAVALDDGVMNFDDHFGGQINHGAGST